MRSLGVLLLALVPGIALANGRPPSTSTINFRKDNEAQIAAGMTFGVVYSKDNGATWSWACEDAVGYGGNYDPDYVITQTGAIFATTFDGLKENRDGCQYVRSSLTATEGPCIDDADADTIENNCPTAGFTCASDGVCEKLKFVSAIALSPDGTLFAAAADQSDAAIYRSTNDGEDWEIAANPGQPKDWWQSIEVAPTDAQRVYLAGYRLAKTREFLMFRSTNGGDSFEPMGTTGLVTSSSSILELASVAKTDIGGTQAEDIVYLIVRLSDNTLSDALYRSVDGGATWDFQMEMPATLSVLARQNGQVVVGTQALGTFVAQETGQPGQLQFTALTNPPHVNCLFENSAGDVWACTQNYGSQTAPKDDYGIMKTSDLVTWTGVLRFQDLMQPQTCPLGTVQKDRCDSELWCGLCAQLNCDPGRDCSVVDAPPADGEPPIKKGSCCQSGSDDIPGLLVIATAIGLVCLRRRPVRRSSPR